MKGKLRIPPKLARDETERLKKYLWMEDWHFESTIKRKCIEIYYYPIYWSIEDDKPHWVNATVYGLPAMRSISNERCIANFFIRYEKRLYQANGIADAVRLIEMLKKENAVIEYKEKLVDGKRLKHKELKAKVKKLTIAA